MYPHLDSLAEYLKQARKMWLNKLNFHDFIISTASYVDILVMVSVADLFYFLTSSIWAFKD